MLGIAVSYRLQKEEEESKCTASLRHRHILLTTAVWYSSSPPVSAPRHCSDFAAQKRSGLCTEIYPLTTAPGHPESIHLTLGLAPSVIGVEQAHSARRKQHRDYSQTPVVIHYNLPAHSIKKKWIEMETTSAFREEELGESDSVRTPF